MKSRKSNRKAAKTASQKRSKRKTASQKRLPKRDKQGRFVKKKTASQKRSKRRGKGGRFVKGLPRDSKGRFVARRPRGPDQVKWIFGRYDDVADDIGAAMDDKGALSQDEFLAILRDLGLEDHDAYTLWFY